MKKNRGHDLTSRTQIGRVFLLLCDPVFVRVGTGDWHTLAEVETAVGARKRTIRVRCPHCGYGHNVELSTDFYTARNRVSELKLEVGPKKGFTIRSRPPDGVGKTYFYRMEKVRTGDLFSETLVTHVAPGSGHYVMIDGERVWSQRGGDG